MAWKKPDLGVYDNIELRGLLDSLTDANVEEFLEEQIPAISPRASGREMLYRMISERKLAYLVWRNAPQGIVTYLDALLGFASGKSAKATKVSEMAGQGGLYAVSPDTRVLPLLLWMMRNAVPMVAVFEGDDFVGIFTTAGVFERLIRSAKEVRKAVAR